MAGAELEIRFTGEDPEQQAAFEQPEAAAPTSPDKPNATPDSDSQAIPPIEPPNDVPRSMQDLLGDIYETLDQDLSEAIRELTDQIESLVFEMSDGRPGRQPQPRAPEEEKQERTGGLIEDLMSRIEKGVDRALDAIGQGDTKSGRTVRGLTQAVTRRGARVGKAVSGVARSIGKTKTARRIGGLARSGLKRVGLGSAAKPPVPVAAGSGAAGAAGAATPAAPAAVEATGGLAAALGPVGITAAAAAVGFVAAAYTVKKLSDAVHGLADDLDDLSPAIAGVKARFEAQHELARLDRAERIGPEVAQLEAARYRIQESMYEVQTKIYELLLKAAPLLELILDGVNVGVRSVDVFLASLEQIRAALTLFDQNDDAAAAVAFATALDGFNDAVKELFTGAASGPVIDPWLAEVLKMKPPAGTMSKPNLGGFGP